MFLKIFFFFFTSLARSLSTTAYRVFDERSHLPYDNSRININDDACRNRDVMTTQVAESFADDDPTRGGVALVSGETVFDLWRRLKSKNDVGRGFVWPYYYARTSRRVFRTRGAHDHNNVVVDCIKRDGSGDCGGVNRILLLLFIIAVDPMTKYKRLWTIDLRYAFLYRTRERCGFKIKK